MDTFKANDFDSDVFAELLEELEELYQSCEKDLIELERAPDDNELQRNLFRAVHTIKGNLGLLGVSPLVEFLGKLEDCLSMLRDGKLVFTSVLSDLMLLSMEDVIGYIRICTATGQFDYDPDKLKSLETILSRLDPEQPAQHEAILTSALLILAPHLGLKEQRDLDIDPDADDPQQDLQFFRQMMLQVETRSRYWQGRCDRQLKLALLINRFAGSPVDEEQLTAACYVHDFGMGFMPISVLHKQPQFTPEETQLVRTHVYCSAKLLENMTYWQEAKLMVLQHHEQVDGGGYPLGLKDEDISDGAKILAIVDTFDAMTHERAGQQHTKRPYQRALAELNNLAGSQLNPFWVTAFNQAMKTLLSNSA